MEVNSLKLAIIQFNPLWEDIQGNIIKIEDFLSTIKGQIDIVILPEMFTTGFSMNTNELAEDVNEKTTKWMKSISTSRKFALCGSIIIKDYSNYFNRFIFVTPDGNLDYYDKRHLFTYAGEHKVYTKGQKRVVFNYLGWNILPQICYDLRFPVWSRNRNDYDLIINVANFPEVRRDVWCTLLKARAIENQCYVAAANRVGVDGNGIEYSGDSMVVGPNGDTICEIETGIEGIIFAEVSKENLRNLRISFPVLDDADNFSL